MRLYTRTGATVLEHPEYGRFEADGDGAFDFPDDLSDELVRFHARKSPLWETQIDRQARLGAEEEARMRDPATLAALVTELVKAQQPAPAAAEAKAPPKAAAAKAADAK